LDGYKCGPIDCLHTWEILAENAYSVREIPYGQYQSTVVDKYCKLLKKYSSQLLVRETPIFINLDDKNWVDKRTHRQVDIH
jgi:hypothetical protein